MKTFIERYEVVRELGRGARGAVYLVRDPHLDRLVALKVLPRARGSMLQRQQLIDDAMVVSKLSHPNIVSFYEAGETDTGPYVAYEYVEGSSLQALLKSQGALPVATAVSMMSQILAGVAYAHEHKVLHLDLGLGNVLVDKSGQARVADFGLAKILGSGVEQLGQRRETLRFMSPEHFLGERLSFASDVFSLGLMFYEMLVGQPAVDGDNELGVIYKITNELLPMPSVANPRIDKKLDLIVLRALQKDSAARYPDAGAMLDALELYRMPRETVPPENRDNLSDDCVIEYLLRRMRRQNDFPVLCKNISAINELASADDEASIGKVTSLVLKDLSVSAKLLKMVNSAFFGLGRTKVTRVSEAVTLLGLAQVRMIASGLILYDHLQQGAAAEALRDSVLQSFAGAILARDLARKIHLQDLEQVYTCGMFRNLGKDLTIYYFNQEYAEIEDLVVNRQMSEEDASRAVLGVPYSGLGMAVARAWNFPEFIVQAMEPLPRDATGQLQTEAVDELRLCVSCAGDLCSAMAYPSAAGRESALAAVTKRYAETLRLEFWDIRDLLGAALEMCRRYAAVLGLNIGEQSFLARLADCTWIPAAVMPAASVEPAAPAVQVDAPDVVAPPAGVHPASKPASSAFRRVFGMFSARLGRAGH